MTYFCNDRWRQRLHKILAKSFNDRWRTKFYRKALTTDGALENLLKIVAKRHVLSVSNSYDGLWKKFIHSGAREIIYKVIKTFGK